MEYERTRGNNDRFHVSLSPEDLTVISNIVMRIVGNAEGWFWYADRDFPYHATILEADGTTQDDQLAQRIRSDSQTNLPIQLSFDRLCLDEHGNVALATTHTPGIVRGMRDAIASCCAHAGLQPRLMSSMLNAKLIMPRHALTSRRMQTLTRKVEATDRRLQNRPLVLKCLYLNVGRVCDDLAPL